MTAPLDAVVVGSGPNGLSAAVELARAGLSVTVLERSERPGGGCATEELTLPGVLHDLCSAVHPLAVASPFLRTLDLGRYGLEFVHPGAPLAHPLDGRPAIVAENDLDATAAALDELSAPGDGDRWRALMEPLVAHSEELLGDVLGPARPPRHPLVTARFGIRALRSAKALSARFDGPAAALLCGIGAHSMVPLTSPATGAFALILGGAMHAAGWPVARGGSRSIADALVACLRDMGGEVRTGVEVRTMRDIPDSRAVVFDVTPRSLLAIAGDELPPRYRRGLERYRYGPGVFKVDWTLDGPIPWSDPACLRAGTVHLGGDRDELVASEAEVAAGRVPEKPFVLVAQQSLFDTTRVPQGRQAVWAYCHVPNGCDADMTEAITAQVERFAPGFRDRVLAMRTVSPRQLEERNPNLVGGDINGGYAGLTQLFTRPVARVDPYTTPNPRLFVCSAATPPGGGVHGMCGYHAAQAVLTRL